MHTGVPSTTAKLRHTQIHKVIADNVPKISTINFMSRRDPVPSMDIHGCTHAHPQRPDNQQEFCWSQAKAKFEREI